MLRNGAFWSMQGGRYLGRALRGNDSLLSINLRLNRLTDDGGRAFLEGLHGNGTIVNINLSANSLGSTSANALIPILVDPSSRLTSLDLSCNNIVNRDVESMAESLKDNKVVHRCLSRSVMVHTGTMLSRRADERSLR